MGDFLTHLTLALLIDTIRRYSYSAWDPLLNTRLKSSITSLIYSFTDDVDSALMSFFIHLLPSR